MGIIIILLSVVFIIYLEFRSITNYDDRSLSDRTDDHVRPCDYLPVYHYSEPIEQDIYRTSD
jgi:hypothetical protein